MVALQGEDCVSVPLSEVVGRSRTVPVDHALLQAACGIGVSLGTGSAA